MWVALHSQGASAPQEVAVLIASSQKGTAPSWRISVLPQSRALLVLGDTIELQAKGLHQHRVGDRSGGKGWKRGPFRVKAW